MNTSKILALSIALLGAFQTASAYCFEAQLGKGVVVTSIETQAANEAAFTRKFNLADTDGRNRGYIILNTVRAIPNPTPYDPGAYMIDSGTSVSTPLGMASHDQNLSKAFEQGWKIVKIRNSSRPVANQNCSQSMMFSDTIQVNDRAGFEFRR